MRLIDLSIHSVIRSTGGWIPLKFEYVCMTKQHSDVRGFRIWTVVWTIVVENALYHSDN